MTVRWRLLRIPVLGLLPILAACANPLYGAQKTRSEMIADRVAVAENPPQAPVIYCYRTLADPDCRTKPEPGQEDRIISYDGANYGSPPR